MPLLCLSYFCFLVLLHWFPILSFSPSVCAPILSGPKALRSPPLWLRLPSACPVLLSREQDREIMSWSTGNLQTTRSRTAWSWCMRMTGGGAPPISLSEARSSSWQAPPTTPRREASPSCSPLESKMVVSISVRFSSMTTSSARGLSSLCWKVWIRRMGRIKRRS